MPKGSDGTSIDRVGYHRGVAEAIAEHADCGGELDVRIDNDSRALVLQCSSCGTTEIPRTLPAARGEADEGHHSALVGGQPQRGSEPAPEATPPAEDPGQAGAEPASEATQPTEDPGQAGASLTGTPVREAPSRPPVWRMLAPVLAVFASFAVLIVALVTLVGSDDAGVVEPTGSAPSRDEQGAVRADRTSPEETRGAAPGTRDGRGRKAAEQGGGDQAGSASADAPIGGPGSMRLGYVEVANTLRVGLPGDWSQRTVTSDGAVVFAPPEASVTVRVWVDTRSELSPREMAEASAELLERRHPGAEVGDPRISGQRAEIRSSYGGGRETAQVVIDGDARILAVASVPDGASRLRGEEAVAVAASVGAA